MEPAETEVSPLYVPEKEGAENEGVVCVFLISEW